MHPQKRRYNEVAVPVNPPARKVSIIDTSCMSSKATEASSVIFSQPEASQISNTSNFFTEEHNAEVIQPAIDASQIVVDGAATSSSGSPVTISASAKISQ